MSTDTTTDVHTPTPSRPSLRRSLLQSFIPNALLAGSSGGQNFGDDLEGAGRGPPSPWPSLASGMLTPISESMTMQDPKHPRNSERRGRTATKKRERHRMSEKRPVTTPEISLSRSPSRSRDMNQPDAVHLNTLPSEPCSALHTPASSRPNISSALKAHRKLHKAHLPAANVTLQNSGAVARDHLASERTFLSYTRTSLALASMGVALVQLFTIADLMAQTTGVQVKGPARMVEKFARPLGVTTVLFAMMVLGVGAYRYFLIQCLLPEGKFPVARASIIAIASVLGAVVVVVFAALIAGRG